MPRKLLILDLDETLMHVPDAPLTRPCDFHIGPEGVYERPGVGHFLDHCQHMFDVAVWSSASPSYVSDVVARMFRDRHPPVFVWDARRCTRRVDPELGTVTWRKNLSKITRLGYDLRSVISIDDSPEKWETGYGNLVRVMPYVGDPGDDELSMLLIYLESLRQEENIRAVEKRGWRHKITVPKDARP